MFQLLRPESQLDTGFSDAELFRQTDLQIAALAWLMHHAQFAEVMQRFGRNRVRTLDGDVLVARGADTLSAAMRFRGIDLSDARIAAIANGPVFRENSKSHAVAFDRIVRQDEHTQVDAARGEEIAMVVRWAEAVAKHCGVPLELGDPLVE